MMKKSAQLTHFEDMLALADVEASGENSRLIENIEGRNQSNTGDNLRWYGTTEGISGVKEIVSNGWESGQSKINKLAGQIDIPPAKSVRRRTVRGASGQNLNMSAVYAGNLSTCWTSRRRQSQRGISKITMLVSVGDHAGVDSEVLFWKGAAAVKVADILNTAGYTVRITGYSNILSHYRNATTTNNEDAVYSYNVKAHQEVLDVDRTATILALGGFFRYFVFKGFCANERPVCSGYGYPEDTTPQALIEASEPDHIIDGFEKVKDLETAREFIKNKITQLQEGA